VFFAKIIFSSSGFFGFGKLQNHFPHLYLPPLGGEMGKHRLVLPTIG
jgi:hypothetical protein